MDFTASAITVVSSVWTLTIHLKRLIEGIKESEEKIKDLEHKARGFATVIGLISDAYGPRGSCSESTLFNPEQPGIRKHIQEQLSSCEEKFKIYEDEVSKLLEERKKGLLGKIKSTWMEKANSKLGVIEQSIEEHSMRLQRLITLDQRSELHETHNDVRTMLGAFAVMFEKIDSLARMQRGGLHDDTNPRGHRLGGPQRRDTEMTLVDPTEGDLNAEDATSSQDENTRSLHALSEILLRILMDPASLQKGFINLPWGQFRNPFAMNLDGSRLFQDEMMGLDPGDAAIGKESHGRANSHQLRAASFSGRKASTDFIPLTPSKTQPSRGYERKPSLSSPPVAERERSHSDLSKSSTLNPNSVSDLGDDTIARQRTQGSFQGRTNKEKGRELVQVIGPKPSLEFDKLLESDASLEERDQSGKTPLLLAAKWGNVDMVKSLLANGCNIQAKDDDKSTVLHIAIAKLRWKVVKILLEPEDITQSTSANKIDSLQINIADNSGRTPLHICTRTNCPETDMARVARLLIAHKADVNAKDKGNLTPIYFAIQDKKESVVDLLLSEGANSDFPPGMKPKMNLRIEKMVENYRLGRAPSLSGSTTRPSRRTSTLSQPEPKSSKSFFSRRSSGAKT